MLSAILISMSMRNKPQCNDMGKLILKELTSHLIRFTAFDAIVLKTSLIYFIAFPDKIERLGLILGLFFDLGLKSCF